MTIIRQRKWRGRVWTVFGEAENKVLDEMIALEKKQKKNKKLWKMA